MSTGFRIPLTIFATAVLTIMILLSGCTKQDNTSVEINTLKDAMLEKFGADTEMTMVDSSFENADELFSYVCDIDYSLVKDYFLSYSTLGKADEIAVAMLESEDAAKLAEESFKNHLNSRKKLFRQYSPEELERTDNAVIFTSGNYAVLIIADNSDEIKKVFEQKING